MSEMKPVTYRFGLRDGTGWLLGLSAAQCLSLAVGVLGAGTALNSGAPLAFVLAPLLAGAGFAFGTWGGRPVHEVAPVAAAWAGLTVTGRQSWHAPLPRWRADGDPARTQPPMPPCLDGLIITEADPGWTSHGRTSSAAIIRDQVEHTSSVVLRVAGWEFSLCERAEQQHLLARWGDALGTFCSERGPVTKVRWIEWAAPAGLDDQVRYLDRHQAAPGDSPAVLAYRRLLDRAGPLATRHDVLVVVTVADHKVHRRGHRGPSAAENLLEEARLLSSRLENAGLTVDLPLTTRELAAVLRSRLDPHQGGGQKRSLTQLAGLITPPNAGPLSVQAEFTHVRVDRTWHAAYVIAEWPRLEVPPNWMEPLMLHNGGVRSIVVHYEPVARSRSQRQIDRDTVKLAADTEQRNRQGFRIGARHQRAQSEIADREAELVAGFPEFEFVGTVHIAAPDADSLERSCAEYEQVAAQIGIELRRLDGQHDLALPCMLPIGRGIAGKRGLA